MSLDQSGKELLRYPNVTGYSKKLRFRQKDGKTLPELCIQIHVTEKIPESKLNLQDMLPRELYGIPIDIISVGDLRIPPLLPESPGKLVNNPKLGIVRPLVAGISIGNFAITAGTLGNFVTKTTEPDIGEIFMASNAHVFADDPQNAESLEKTIIQPGRHDGGEPTDVIGEYYWHNRLNSNANPDSECIISRTITKSLNIISKAFRRKTRFSTYVDNPIVNKIDFAVARCTNDFMDKHYDHFFDPQRYNIVGYGFAGSNITSLVCKMPYVETIGYKATIHEYHLVEPSDRVIKIGRSCASEAEVLDDSCFEIVNYGNAMITFDDVIMTKKLLEPGDSGSAIYREIK